MIWIQFNVPSLKNSKIKTSRGIFPSKTVMKYLRKLGIAKYSVSKKIVKGYATRPNQFEDLRAQFEEALKDKSPPFVVALHFVRDSKRKFDFHNAVQIIADLMVAHDFIEDDNMDYFIPTALLIEDKYYSVDKECPGVWIEIN